MSLYWARSTGNAGIVWVKWGLWCNNWIAGHPRIIPPCLWKEIHRTERRNLNEVLQLKAPWNSMMRSRYEWGWILIYCSLKYNSEAYFIRVGLLLYDVRSTVWLNICGGGPTASRIPFNSEAQASLKWQVARAVECLACCSHILVLVYEN